MKLSHRQKYDYRDLDMGELKLIRVGLSLWSQLKQLRAQNGGYVSERHPLYEALQTVWRLKRERRAELRQKRAVRSSKLREKFADCERWVN